ncbi:MAG: TrkA C-terminal domain-containing protein [Halobacteriales archaeon]|nr:TrkA C-terminal domain-containing protein [Halobacteriales archaeon]
MNVKESDLPGVGKKFTLEADDTEIIIILHNTGRREIFTRESPDDDSEKVLELSDKESRLFASILEGAYFQPVADDPIEATLTDDENLIEWLTVGDGSSLVGKTLAEADIRDRYGVSVIAVQGEDTVPNPKPDTVIEAGQTLVLVGPEEGYEELKDASEGDSDEDGDA